MQTQNCFLCGTFTTNQWRNGGHHYHNGKPVSVSPAPEDLYGTYICVSCYWEKEDLESRVRNKLPQKQTVTHTPTPTAVQTIGKEISDYNFFSKVSSGYCACNIPRNQCDYHK